MQEALSGEKSIYLEICEAIETDILRGVLVAQDQAPSANELARLYAINAATAAKGVNILVEQGILYKRRGIGTFVAPEARELVLSRRREEFASSRLPRLIEEAHSLGISTEELVRMIEREGKDEQP